MLTPRQKSLLHALLGMVLLFVGGASSFTLAVDEDGDAGTPPLKVELNFVAQKKSSALAAEQIAHRVRQCECGTSAEHMIESLEHPPVTGPGQGSLELLPPLRT